MEIRVSRNGFGTRLRAVCVDTTDFEVSIRAVAGMKSGREEKWIAQSHCRWMIEKPFIFSNRFFSEHRLGKYRVATAVLLEEFSAA